MTSDGVLLERERQIGQVLAELCRLALSDHTYVDVVQSVLALVEQLVSCPLLCLSIRERERVGHYARAGRDVDASWAEETGRAIADVQEHWLLQPKPMTQILSYPSTAGTEGWIRMFPVWSRSGRGCALSLGAAEPVHVSADEETMMARVAEQVLLVLDHALLLQDREELQTTDGLTGTANPAQ